MYTCSACAKVNCPNYNTLESAEGCDDFEDGGTCSYCAALRESSDPSILCNDCQECFGHARYDEL